MTGLGYDAATTERDFIPVMLLRNEVDVGHVQLAIFKRRHLAVIHSFLQAAELKFQHLLQNVLDEIEAGTWDVPPYEDTSPDQDVVQIIERMEKALTRQREARDSG